MADPPLRAAIPLVVAESAQSDLVFSFLRGSRLGELVSLAHGELAQSRMTVSCYKALSDKVPELKTRMAHTLLSQPRTG